MRKTSTAAFLFGTLLLVPLLCLSCSKDKANTKLQDDAPYATVEQNATEPTGGKFSGLYITVKTTFAGTDGNANNFQNCIKEWQHSTGCKIIDTSANSGEAFKARVIDDFDSGTEPDVLFFFTGADSNKFISENKVVPIDEIRRSYSSYAANMDATRVPKSLVDGKAYAIPVNGYWEALYYNAEILKQAGVAIPGPSYTMTQFKSDCAKIKDAGLVPIAAALGDVPHYWWEFMIFNRGTVESHDIIPKSADDKEGSAWVNGLEDLKDLYEMGFFPEDTLTVSDAEIFTRFATGKAAFLAQGSWKCNGIVWEAGGAEAAKKFGVAFFPGSKSRKATDIIGGISMGYYITRKAWNNPKKRDAAVDFVSFMTNDRNVSLFAEHSITALRKTQEVDMNKLNPLQIKAVDFLKSVTSLTPAVQDIFQGECRKSTFEKMDDLVTGRTSIYSAVQEGFDKYYGN